MSIANIGIFLVIGAAVLALLPKSPVVALIEVIAGHKLTFLAWVNWFIPVGEMATIMEIWLAALAAFYVISMLLRWIKVVK